MAVIAKQRYKLDIAPKGGWVIVYASQHDNEAREIEFEIKNQGNAYSIPASINISVQGIKSNKGYFSHSCSYSGNVVTMALADDMTDVVGKAICVLKFTNSSQKKLATAKFILNVDSDSSSEGIIVDTEVEAIFNQMLNEIRAQAASVSADIAELQSMVGSPLVASTVSAMTNHNKIYVYIGSESGYTNGNWYYWNGSAWTSGGVYNSVAVNMDSVPTQGSNNTVSSGGVYNALNTLRVQIPPIDSTLTQAGQAADAKETGDKITSLKSALNDLASVKSEISFSQTGNSAIALNMAVGQTVSLTPYQVSTNTWRYAVIPCVARQKVELNLNGGSTPRAYGFIDENNILLAVANYGPVQGTVIAPEGTSKMVLNDNGNGTAYFITPEGRVDALEKEVAELKTESIETIAGNNIYDSGKNVYGKMFYESNNNVIWYENEYTTEYTSVIIPVESEYVTFSSDNAGTRLARYYFTTSDTLPTEIISSAIPNQDIGTGYTVQVPDNAIFMCCSFRNLTENTNMMANKGQTALPYEPYSIGYYVNGEKIQMESGIDAEYIKVPSEYNLVVGDTFQLFYKGIINAVYPEIYDVVVSCAKGKAFERFYEITPSVAETLAMTISLYGLSHELLESKIITLNIHEKASSPSAVKNVLCVGNSLTVNGEWVKEVHRRLTQTGGTPEGDGLSNINFIGTKTSNGVHYEGYGGWTFRSYNTENVSENSKVITCSHDKTQDDQHSIYRASNNSTWKLETIESGQIKILNVSGSPSTFPSTGTLTWVSGGTNRNDIVYTASANSAGNPFWNSATNRVDFANYASLRGVSSIDYVYVLLGWNSAGTKEADYKAMAQTFIDNVHASFPNAEIVLIGLEIPARDGLANNYGASGIYSQYYTLMRYVFDLDKWYDDLSVGNAHVSHFNLSGQFDTEYNMQTATRQVNTRNSATETYQSNGVHPANSGYMQIADAVYRDITAKL